MTDPTQMNIPRLGSACRQESFSSISDVDDDIYSTAFDITHTCAQFAHGAHSAIWKEPGQKRSWSFGKLRSAERKGAERAETSPWMGAFRTGEVANKLVRVEAGREADVLCLLREVATASQRRVLTVEVAFRAGFQERNGATAQSHHATQDFIQTPRLLQTWSFVRKALRPRADVPRRFTRRVPAGCISNALRCLAQQRAVKWMSRKICAALLLSVPPPSGPMQTSGSVQRLPLEGSRRRPGCPPDQIVHHGVADYAIQ
eukprot:s3121_g7.t1